MFLLCLDSQQIGKVNHKICSVYSTSFKNPLSPPLLLHPPRNEIRMQLQISYRHFKANELHPSAVGKTGSVSVGGGVYQTLPSDFSAPASSLVSGKEEGGSVQPLYLLICLFSIPTSAPPCPKPASGYQVVGAHIITCTHTNKCAPTSTTPHCL